MVVIDEAAAIPLHIVRSLLGPHLVFLASTINGYEGTGRSLSLKLLQELRQQAATLGSKTTGESVSNKFVFVLFSGGSLRLQVCTQPRSL